VINIVKFLYFRALKTIISRQVNDFGALIWCLLL